MLRVLEPHLAACRVRTGRQRVGTEFPCSCTCLHGSHHGHGARGLVPDIPGGCRCCARGCSRVQRGGWLRLRGDPWPPPPLPLVGAREPGLGRGVTPDGPSTRPTLTAAPGTKRSSWRLVPALSRWRGPVRLCPRPLRLLPAPRHPEGPRVVAVPPTGIRPSLSLCPLHPTPPTPASQQPRAASLTPAVASGSASAAGNTALLATATPRGAGRVPSLPSPPAQAPAGAGSGGLCQERGCPLAPARAGRQAGTEARSQGDTALFGQGRWTRSWSRQHRNGSAGDWGS